MGGEMDSEKKRQSKQQRVGFGCCEFSVGSSAARTHDDNDLGKVAEQRRLRQKRRDFWTANPLFYFPK
ncbi:hypothetical protein L3X38_035216 [Prunus dulcis]|uniref:Uncharacterized protein n=1 Tax=Prunus dulcis TaxID=3755 RepID=A0AAD4VL03_PRUDU|nr:hypothetical protein L3X38_035216 [Prunus dulcis]